MIGRARVSRWRSGVALALVAGVAGILTVAGPGQARQQQRIARRRVLVSQLERSSGDGARM